MAVIEAIKIACAVRSEGKQMAKVFALILENFTAPLSLVILPDDRVPCLSRVSFIINRENPNIFKRQAVVLKKPGSKGRRKRKTDTCFRCLNGGFSCSDDPFHNVLYASAPNVRHLYFGAAGGFFGADFGVTVGALRPNAAQGGHDFGVTSPAAQEGAEIEAVGGK
jgi:hypothetical protein